MIVWRITRERFQALDGEGARLNGGRWNSEGKAVVCTSCSLSLAALEYLVHIDPEDVPSDLIAMRIEILDSIRGDGIPESYLPRDWSMVPDHPECIRRGDAWLCESGTLFVRVPSAVVPEEENILLYPAHADAALVIVRETRPFAFAPRLLA